MTLTATSTVTTGGSASRRNPAAAGILFLMTLLGGCGPEVGQEGQAVRTDPSIPSDLGACFPYLPEPDVEELAGGLETPWGLAQAPDGRIFVTERPGRIRVVGEEGLDPEPWATLDTHEEGELGLMGIVLSPEFADDGALYVMGHFLADSEQALPSWITPVVRRVRARLRRHDEGTRFVSHIYRVSRSPDGEIQHRRVVSSIPAGQIHGGGALAFDPSGALVYSVGDAQMPWSAQDPQRVPGKILRRGSLSGDPGDPPRLPDEIVAFGIRNSQGIAVHEASGTVLFVDHGPTGLVPEARRLHRDELNVLRESGNYGWPVESGAVEESRFLDPVVDWTPAVAPAGLAISQGGEPDPLRIVAWVASLRGQALHRVELQRESEGEPWRATCEDRFLEGEYGRLRAVMVGEEGEVYVATSNRDGRGGMQEGDDRLLRVRLPGRHP